MAVAESELPDTELQNLERAAWQDWSMATNQVVGAADYSIYLDGYQSGLIAIYPLNEVTEIKYFDENNTEQTLSDTLYDLQNVGMPYKALCFKEGVELPDLAQRHGAVIVKINAGWASPPQVAKMAVLMTMTKLYDIKGDAIHRHTSVIDMLKQNSRIYVGL